MCWEHLIRSTCSLSLVSRLTLSASSNVAIPHLLAVPTTTGYGDLSATNVQEMIYAIAVMVAGKLIFGFILGSIASTLANMDTQRVLFEEKLNGLKVSTAPLRFF